MFIDAENTVISLSSRMKTGIKKSGFMGTEEIDGKSSVVGLLYCVNCFMDSSFNLVGNSV